MSVRNLKDGSKKPWLCECYPQGRNGKRVRKRFATKGEANAYENFVMREVDDKPWMGGKADRRSLLDMIDLWQERHGQSLANAKQTYNRLMVICNGLGDPFYSKLTANMFTEYRSKRIAGEVADLNGKKTAVSFSTCNHEQAIFNSMISELQSMGEWKGENPLANVRQFKLHETEMDFLSIDEMQSLIAAAESHSHPDLHKFIKLCLATGGRFREVARLTGSQINSYDAFHNNGDAIKKHTVTFTQTKGKKNRTVPIGKEEFELIYTGDHGPLFSISYATVQRFIAAQVPRLNRQAAHVLRHTYASYFMMNRGNIITLQRILGHSDIKLTMRYSHLSPDHLEEAVNKSPIAMLRNKNGD